MFLYIFSDESGVFDYKHEKIFIFAGIIFCSKDDRDNCERNFVNIENSIKLNKNITNELKGSMLDYHDKKRIIKMIAKYAKIFIVKIQLDKIHKEIFNSKKSKQRYLDYAYKIGLKKCLTNLNFNLDNIQYLIINQDQHTTATDGIYELGETIFQEFKYGTFNYGYDVYHEPITDNLKNVNVNFYDSKKKNLIRAADICANGFYYCFKHNKELNISNVIIISLP